MKSQKVEIREEYAGLVGYGKLIRMLIIRIRRCESLVYLSHAETTSRKGLLLFIMMDQLN